MNQRKRSTMAVNFRTSVLGIICLITVLCASPFRHDNGTELSLQNLFAHIEDYKLIQPIADDVLLTVMKDYEKFDGLAKKGNKSPENDVLIVTTEVPTTVDHTVQDGTAITTEAVEMESIFSESLFSEESVEEFDFSIFFDVEEDGTETPKETVSFTEKALLFQNLENLENWTANDTASPTSTDTPPDLCQEPSIDTITRTQDGSTYVFKGDFYWKVIYDGIAEGYPRRIADDWGGLEGNLDASFTTTFGRTFFFKGSHYWGFINKEMNGDFPKLISEGFVGIPDNVDAAFTWSHNGKAYFFKGDKYWRYDWDDYPRVHPAYPSPVYSWKGLPVNDIDAAFVWEDNYSYFFVGGNFYRYDDPADAVAISHPPYPHPTAPWWFSCPQNCNSLMMKRAEKTKK